MSWMLLVGIGAFVLIGGAFVVVIILLGKGKDE